MRSEFCKTKELVLIWWEFSIFIKTFVLRFINLFCRAYFKGNGETCTFWILMHFRNTVHDWYCFFFFFYNFKTQKFSIFCIFICYLMTTFISFALIVMSMPNNAFFIQYHFNSIPLTCNSSVVGCFNNKNNWAYDLNLLQYRIGFIWFYSSFKLWHFFVSLC